ncbi:MAG: TraR/DksA C4-type zinc finger protein [Firmicutes bacterium]|nr:TraR/DksA C4-type zinc finger protein [Bacillota bacterium]
MKVERRCELCHKPIPRERLEALPQTRRCVDCARRNGSDVFARRVGIGMDIDTYKDLLGATRS